MYIDRKVPYSIREQGKDYNTGEKRLHQETKAEKNQPKTTEERHQNSPISLQTCWRKSLESDSTNFKLVELAYPKAGQKNKSFQPKKF